MKGLVATKLTYRRVGLILTLAALVTFALSYAGVGTHGAAPYLAQATFDGWSYTLSAEGENDPPIAHISYDRSTVALLRHYAQVNVGLAHELAAGGQGDLLVSVTFRKPLSVDEFRAWAARMPIQVDDYQFRVLGKNGQPWTLGGAPTGGRLVSDSDLQRNLANLASRGATNFLGVIVVGGRIPASAYDQLAGDPLVFLADVTKSAAAAHITKTVNGINMARLVVLVAPCFGDLERLGLENFR